MAHKRKQIRDALKNRLLGTAPTYSTSAEERVYTNLAYLKDKAKIPLIHLIDGSEESTLRDMRTSLYIRRFQIQIEIKVSASNGVDEILDDLCTEIETLINADRTLGGVCHAAVYLSAEEPTFEPGEKTIASTRLTYEFQYLT